MIEIITPVTRVGATETVATNSRVSLPNPPSATVDSTILDIAGVSSLSVAAVLVIPTVPVDTGYTPATPTVVARETAVANTTVAAAVTAAASPVVTAATAVAVMVVELVAVVFHASLQYL